jgi:hypothetical protein
VGPTALSLLLLAQLVPTSTSGPRRSAADPLTVSTSTAAYLPSNAPPLPPLRPDVSRRPAAPVSPARRATPEPPGGHERGLPYAVPEAVPSQRASEEPTRFRYPITPASAPPVLPRGVLRGELFTHVASPSGLSARLTHGGRADLGFLPHVQGTLGAWASYAPASSGATPDPTIFGLRGLMFVGLGDGVRGAVLGAGLEYTGSLERGGDGQGPVVPGDPFLDVAGHVELFTRVVDGVRVILAGELGHVSPLDAAGPTGGVAGHAELGAIVQLGEPFAIVPSVAVGRELDALALTAGVAPTGARPRLRLEAIGTLDTEAMPRLALAFEVGDMAVRGDALASWRAELRISLFRALWGEATLKRE